MSLIIVLGPTASGKTALSIELAKQFNGEIVGADSVQIYKDLVIGSAAPTEDEKMGILHHLVGVYDLNKETNAGVFVNEASVVVEDIISRGKKCIMVGGTNFYVESFLKGLSPVPEIEKKMKNEINEELDKFSTEELYDLLLKIDPVWSKAISSPNDRQRIKRGLEVYKATGTTLSNWNKKERKNKYNKDYFAFAIDVKRETLYEKINKRSKLMIDKGLVDEVGKINRMGYNSSNCKALNSIGYKETEMYLEGKISTLEELESVIAQNTRNLAKRQLTWIRNRDYIASVKKEDVEKQVKEFFEM
jgi:tRNA dimethylallyltransferase